MAPFCEEHGCWPSKYILGAQKAATTSVFYMLEDAGLVCGRSGSGYFTKEAHFFDTQDYWVEHRGNEHYDAKLRKKQYLRDYLKAYDNSTCKAGVFMDATPSYLREYNAATRMQVVVPPYVLGEQARFLMIFREPIARDISYYNMFRSEWLRKSSKSSDPDKVDGLGSIKMQLCGSNKNAFPTYTESMACQLTNWQDICLNVSDDELRALEASTDATEYTRKLLAAYDTCALGSLYVPGNTRTRLTDGMYAAQLPKFASIIPREHILMLKFEALVDPATSADYIERILSFFGFTAPKALVLPKNNEVEFPGKVALPSCALRDKVDHILGQWNEALYEMLESDHNSGLAPKNEPAFEPFAQIDCDAHEEGSDAASDTAADAQAAAAGAAAGGGNGTAAGKQTQRRSRGGKGKLATAVLVGSVGRGGGRGALVPAAL